MNYTLKRTEWNERNKLNINVLYKIHEKDFTAKTSKKKIFGTFKLLV